MTRFMRALAPRPDVHLAILFGSHARGVAHVRSDVDVAVDAGDTDLLALAAELAATLGCEVYLVPLDRAGYPLLLELIEHGVVVHEGRPGAAPAWRSRALVALDTDRPWFERMRNAWSRRLRQGG